MHNLAFVERILLWTAIVVIMSFYSAHTHTSEGFLFLTVIRNCFHGWNNRGSTKEKLWHWLVEIVLCSFWLQKRPKQETEFFQILAKISLSVRSQGTRRRMICFSLLVLHEIRRKRTLFVMGSMRYSEPLKWPFFGWRFRSGMKKNIFLLYSKWSGTDSICAIDLRNRTGRFCLLLNLRVIDRVCEVIRLRYHRIDCSNEHIESLNKFISRNENSFLCKPLSFVEVWYQTGMNLVDHFFSSIVVLTDTNLDGLHLFRL